MLQHLALAGSATSVVLFFGALIYDVRHGLGTKAQTVGTAAVVLSVVSTMTYILAV